MAKSGLMQMLRNAERTAMQELAGIQAAIKAMAGSVASDIRGRSARKKAGRSRKQSAGGRKRRKFSAATIAKRRRAQKARWTKRKSKAKE